VKFSWEDVHRERNVSREIVSELLNLLLRLYVFLGITRMSETLSKIIGCQPCVDVESVFTSVDRLSFNNVKK
jgi:hypothetical protein